MLLTLAEHVRHEVQSRAGRPTWQYQQPRQDAEQTCRRASSAVTTDPAAMLRVCTAKRRISRAKHVPSRLQC